MSTSFRLLCRLPLLGLLSALCLVWGCRAKARPPMPPVSRSEPAVTEQAAGSPAADGPEADSPAASAAPAPQKKQARPSHIPRFIDDRYGPGALGPRILSHESEIVAVAPQRMDLYLRAGSGQEAPPDAAARAAAASASGPGERPQTLTAAGDGADMRNAGPGRDVSRGDKAGGSRTSRAVEAEARAARPVRVWEVREPRAARNASPLSPAEVDTRAYLARLGIRSVYDLSPGSRRLALPGGLRPLPGNSAPLQSGGHGGAPATLTPRQWEEMIQEAGRLFGLDPRFIAAVIRVESNFDHRAVSPKGAQGAMQIMPGTQAQLGLEDPFDVRANIHAGCAFFRELLLQYGSTELALAAYNAGPGAVDRYGGIPPYAETQNYVRRVMALWQGEETPPAFMPDGREAAPGDTRRAEGERNKFAPPLKASHAKHSGKAGKKRRKRRQ